MANGFHRGLTLRIAHIHERTIYLESLLCLLALRGHLHKFRGLPVLLVVLRQTDIQNRLGHHLDTPLVGCCFPTLSRTFRHRQL